MANTLYVQVATDGSGKKVMMDSQVMPDGNTGYMQLALLTGDPADALQQMNATLKQILFHQRAMLHLLTQITNMEVSAENFEDFEPLSS